MLGNCFTTTSANSGSKKVNLLEIEAAKLKERLDNGEDLFILDVRTAQEHEAWKLSYDKYKETSTIPIDKLVNSHNQVAEEIPKDKEIVTLCGHGNKSQMAAQLLSKMGYNVRSLKGGMAAWNQVYDVAEVPLANVTTQDHNQLRVWQMRRVSKGCMTYVIASGNNATVIDSTCDLDSSVLQLAKSYGLSITNVVDTHMHADHVSGLSALAKRTGARAYFGALEGYQPMSDLGIDLIQIGDGQQIPLGNGLSLKATHTPGHTPGSLCFVLNEDSYIGNMKYLFTGDTIFVNGVGRPDLHDKAKEFAANLYSTYQDRILKYPDDTVILPAHFDTNSITVKHKELIADTIGSVRKKIRLLSIPRDEFIQFMVSSVPPRPANYEKIIQINKALTPCDRVDMGDLEAGPNSCAIRM